MRIAVVAPLHEAVPPKLYGGTERVVSYLTEELVGLGEDVTLFASGDSVTSATLVEGCRQALRLDPNCQEPALPHLIQADLVTRLQDDFDIIHFHGEPYHFPTAAAAKVPTLTTLHGRLDLPDYLPFYRHFAKLPLASISASQRRPSPNLAWQGTVHHGLPPDLLRPRPGKGGYLAFLGRISAEKGVIAAIAIARRVGLPLRVAAKVDPRDQAYYEKIRPHLDSPHVEFVGEITDTQKNDFLGDAAALLFPIDWPEPFGLVMIEAMACGTPVLAFRQGAVPEIIEDGVTGCLVDGIDAAVAACARIDALDRAAVRRRFEQRWTARRMANDYVALYERLIRDAALPPGGG